MKTVPLEALSINESTNQRQALAVTDTTPSIMFRQNDDRTMAIVNGHMRANALASLGHDVPAVELNSGRVCKLRRTHAGDWIEV